MTNSRRNRYAFGLGTIGRDMLYSLVSMYFMYILPMFSIFLTQPCGI